MMIEDSTFDKKSIRALNKKNPDWREIAKDCVAFANTSGGKIIFGIEDGEDKPPLGQVIDRNLMVRLKDKIEGLTMNVSVFQNICTHSNSGEYLELTIQGNISAIASTSDGRYYMRVGDQCRPILPDELNRLMEEKGQFIWETKKYLNIHWTNADYPKQVEFLDNIRSSVRVTQFIKNKTDKEILDYYYFTSGDSLTNLGVLWIGKREDRARLLYAPTIQFIKYDEYEHKINKIVWDDFSKNPKELFISLVNDISDWKEGVEIEDGVYRKNILNYEESVIRELFANALVHKPYATRGDIFVNLYSDRLEVHNPGRLPLGVTPANILHATIQRNQHLAKVFYDLNLMEKEGSGYDTVYESLLTSGKPLPILVEGDDRVMVTVEKRIVNKDIVEFLARVNQDINLTSKEKISLGLIAQYNSLTRIEFMRILGIKNEYDWLGRLVEF
jgi:ATP-dependent DNA helicase RecG